LALNGRYHYRNGKYEGKPHQYNCTYFSALRKVPQDYLLARAIQFFTPGMPMVGFSPEQSMPLDLRKEDANLHAGQNWFNAEYGLVDLFALLPPAPPPKRHTSSTV